uniref:Uncharacterized protein n=1 Tax=Anguilla anguilla TaxID=7936 RepID=A0A0E9PBX9_ANGAN
MRPSSPKYFTKHRITTSLLSSMAQWCCCRWSSMVRIFLPATPPFELKIDSNLGLYWSSCDMNLASRCMVVILRNSLFT